MDIIKKFVITFLFILILFLIVISVSFYFNAKKHIQPVTNGNIALPAKNNDVAGIVSEFDEKSVNDAVDKEEKLRELEAIKLTEEENRLREDAKKKLEESEKRNADAILNKKRDDKLEIQRQRGSEILRLSIRALTVRTPKDVQYILDSMKGFTLQERSIVTKNLKIAMSKVKR